jgi:protein-tyrosine-phosphatase
VPVDKQKLISRFKAAGFLCAMAVVVWWFYYNDTDARHWHENKIGVVSLAEMRVIKKIPTEDKPDGSTYAAPFHKLYVSDERGKAEAVVDTTRDEIVRTLRFESETGMPQYDPVAKRVWLNLQDQDVLAEIDPATDAVVGRYPVGRCKGNHGMALDAEHRRAFLSCEGNDLMTVFDLEQHRPIAFLPMAAGPDVIKFDAGLRRIYVACGSGAISVFQEDDPNRFSKLGDVPVQRKVHSLAVDPETHRVYAPEQEEDGKPIARMLVFEAEKMHLSDLPATKCADPSPPQIIVFVCEHGAAKSVIAAAYFNKLVTERHANFHAIARGVAPQAQPSEATVSGLRKDGLAFLEERPQALSREDLLTAQRVIAFCPLPAAFPKPAHFDLYDVPAPKDDYSASRDAILARVKRVVDELQANAQRP